MQTGTNKQTLNLENNPMTTEHTKAEPSSIDAFVDDIVAVFHEDK